MQIFSERLFVVVFFFSTKRKFSLVTLAFRRSDSGNWFEGFFPQDLVLDCTEGEKIADAVS